MTNREIVKKELKDKFFHEYKKVPWQSDSLKHLYQKRYRDEKGTKYFIDVEEWEIRHPSTGEDLGGYEIKSQLYTKNYHDAINITFLDNTISTAEAFIDKLFDADMLDYYEENE